jgi:adenylate cyclase, class 2
MVIHNSKAPLEIEIKFFLKNPMEIRNRIITLGAKTLGRYFEKNIRFEDVAHQLIGKRSLLRLRKDKKSTLTYKSEPSESDNEFKVLNELEVEVDDFEVMQRILESLGFHREQVYEKWRETFRIEDATLCIDEMPFGAFLEIEGTRHGIKALVKSLGFNWEKRILWNYLAMFETLHQKYSLSFTDVTFENFLDTRIDIEKEIHRFEAGDDTK